jgi:hypothetical protein
MATPAAAVCIVTRMPRAELARLCKAYGAQLSLANTDDGDGKPIDGPTLLWAMSGRESNFGRNMTPRHEPAYDVNGYYWNRSADVKRGCAVYGKSYACSYGPLQIMAVNAPEFNPIELGADPEKAFKAAVWRLNKYVIAHLGAKTIEAICDCWNTGNYHDENIPHEYINDVRLHYFTEVIG